MMRFETVAAIELMQKIAGVPWRNLIYFPLSLRTSVDPEVVQTQLLNIAIAAPLSNLFRPLFIEL